MTHIKSILAGLSLLFAATLAQAQAGSVLIDSWKIRFYETKQIHGEETYQISQSPNGDLIVQARTEMPFAGQENKPLVNATLRTAKDLTPQSFEIKGPTLLDLEEATSITVQGKTATIQDRGQNKSVEVPRNFFTMSGYVPVSVASYIDGKNEGHSFDVQVETPEEVRAAVQRYKDAGYEQLKIRNAVPDGMNALQAVEAGMDQLAHLNYVESGFFPKRDRNNPPVTINLNAPNVTNALRFFKEHGTVIDPTDAVLELMLRPMNMPIESFEPGVTKLAQSKPASVRTLSFSMRTRSTTSATFGSSGLW